jgi:hypothetical protein
MVPTLQAPTEPGHILKAQDQTGDKRPAPERGLALSGAYTPGCGDWADHFTAGRLAVFIIFFLFVQYPEVLLGSHSFFDRDYGIFTYPLAHFGRASLWHGELPLWNPLNHSGIPFLAQWNTTVLYPLSWFYFLLPLPWSLGYFCLGHLVLAGLAMYWLAFRWTGNRFAASVAGLIYALNGLSFNALMWTSILAALAWMPLVILFTERAWRQGGREIIPAALAGGMQMLSGAPEIILMTWLLTGSLWLVEMCRQAPRRSLSAARLAAVGLLVFGLAAAQLLPFFELLANSDRHAGQGNEVWSMPAWGWANFIVPLFRCTRTILGAYIQPGQQWTSSYYLGLGGLTLAAIAVARLRDPRVWWLAGASFFGLVLALGDHGIVYPVIARVFPPLALARYPVKFVMITAFAVPLLAAYGVVWMSQKFTSGAKTVQRSLAWTSVVWAASTAAILIIAQLSPMSGETLSVTVENGLVRLLFLLLSLGAILFQLRAASPARAAALGYAFLLALGLDALTHVPRQNATIPNRGYGPMDLGLNSIPQVGRSRAMVSPQLEAFLGHASTPNPLDCYTGARHSLYMDCNLIDAIPVVGGFYPMNLRREAEVRGLFSSQTNLPSGLADFLAIGEISSSDQLWEWTHRRTSLPWVTAGQKPLFQDDQSTLRGLASSDFNPRAVVYLPLEAQGQVLAKQGTEAQLVSSSFGTRSDFIEVNAAEPAWVVFSQAWYPAWKAYLNGKPVKLWRANHAYQALEVPAGKHRVELRYEDRAFYAGSVVSALTFLGLGIWFWVSRRTLRLA